MGADINFQDEYGWAALMHVAAKGHTDVIWILIENGADLNINDRKIYNMGQGFSTRIILKNKKITKIVYN